jgi:LPXTG-site transpeptidase (sortase) family protein
MRYLGNLLIAVSLLGALVLGLLAAEVTPPWDAESPAPLASTPQLSAETVPVASSGAQAIALGRPADVPSGTATDRIAAPTAVAPGLAGSAAGQPAAPGSAPSGAPGQPAPAATNGVASAIQPPPAGRQPIERVVVERIGLDAPVVAASLVNRAGAVTWAIPAYKAGHADGTAGAGAPGNAVLLGHVDSLRSGDVFRNLEKVALGDTVTVWSGERAYSYRIVETRTVGRADTALVGTTETAALTLVTCAGAWSPLLWDYTERFIVRAELSPVVAG